MANGHHGTFDGRAFFAKPGPGRRIVKHGAGETIFSQGADADAVFFMLEGKAKMTVLSEDGKEAVIGLLTAEDFFGEGCLAGQPRRLATISTITKCALARIERAALVRLLHEEAAFAETFITHVLAQTIRVQENLVDQLFNSSEKRLARVLLLLANFGKEGRHEPIVANVSQETLAKMIGTTRPRVSYFMNKFRRLGLIEYNGHVEVHSSLLNVILHG
jgi:CRP/FNR family cyclic AMP-dependent transcriptional regulator